MDYYKRICINDVTHNIAALMYDDSQGNCVAKVFMASFYTRQGHDNFLASIQKGISFVYSSEKLTTTSKSYVSNLKKCSNDNIGDGWHALFYSEDQDALIVNKGEDIKEKVYEHLKKYKSGILPEWKDYFYNTLIDYDCLIKCKGFDLTGGFCPEVYMFKGVDTDLIRSIKSNGLKAKEIFLPVENNKELDANMQFIDIIEQLILPYVESENAYYNLGEDISSIIKSPIRKNNKMVNLFPRQQVIAQGILNFLKDDNKTCVLNGGPGVGKTYTGAKLAYAVVREYYKRKSGVIGVFCPGHLTKNWTDEFLATLAPIGVNPNIRVIENYKDISKLPKKPNGLEIIVFPKDTTKREYRKKHTGIYKHSVTSDIKKFVKTLGKSRSSMQVTNCIGLARSKIRYASAVYTKEYEQKILFYRKVKKKNGDIAYICTTNSITLKNYYGSTNKTYDFIVSSLTGLKNKIKELSNQIINEKPIKFKEGFIENYITCPCCGGKIYKNYKHILDNEKHEKYLRNPYGGNKNNELAECNNFVKADGTSITEEEMEMLRLTKNYVIVEKYSKINYVDDDGNPIVGEDLLRVKNYKLGMTNPNSIDKREPPFYKLQIRKCNYPMFGYKEVKGYNCCNAAKYLKKLYGKGYIDICLYDESHEYNKTSDQGQTMGHLCKVSKINILLSGTITGGKASDLYYTFWRTSPSKMKSLGYDYEDESIFVEHYGRKKRNIIETEERYSSTGSGQTRMVAHQWSEIPGISPLLYNNLLSGIMVSRKIEDMGIPLPKITYIKEEVSMTEEQQHAYDKLKNDLINFSRNNPKISLGGVFTKKLKAYPDYPRFGKIYVKDTRGVYGTKGAKIFAAEPTILDTSQKPLPKERKLLETLVKEIRQKRKVIVYTEFTGLGVSKRLLRLLSKFFNVREFTRDTCRKINQREVTIEKWAEEGVDVIICNPALVKTGLNLMSYPTMYFFDQPYDVKTIRQAEKRAYRPLQTKECRVYYAFYSSCIQEDAIKLIGTKKRASEALEGVFSNDCLSAMGDGGDSVESILNKALDGKIEFKEDAIDSFNFETVNYDIVEVAEEDIKEVEKVEEKVEEYKTINTMFELNTSFMDQLNKLKQESNIKKPNENISNVFSQLNKLKANGNEEKVENKKEVAATKHEQVGFSI